MRLSRSELLFVVTSTAAGKWTEHEILAYLEAHPQRAFFSRLFRDGGFTNGMEVGVAGGRFSEHFLRDNAGRDGPWRWTMVEPYPPRDLRQRLEPPAAGSLSWAARGRDANVELTFLEMLSSDARALALPNASFDFIYLDGAHDYANVKQEVVDYWPKVRVGGVLAGHDYCTHGEHVPHACIGCKDVPACGVYTHPDASGTFRRAKTQVGVVRAVHEWLVEQNPGLNLAVHHTLEDFTAESLASEGISWHDLVLTKTRNPSWYIVKTRGTVEAAASSPATFQHETHPGLLVLCMCLGLFVGLQLWTRSARPRHIRPERIGR